MSQSKSEDVFQRQWVMDRAWMRDEQGIVHTGEALMLAMLLKVKKNQKGRTDEQVAELEEIVVKKPKTAGRRKK